MPDRSKDPPEAPAIARRPGAGAPGWQVSDRPAPDPLDQHDFMTRLEWGLTGVRRLAPVVDLVVVVDVLSFSTAVTIAVERGARVVPYPFRDGTAAAYSKSIGAILASPNRGARGPTLSPTSLRVLRPGDTLVLPSPNGAACAVAAAEAGTMVVAGCLRNASAVGRLLAAHGGARAVIAAGETWPDDGLRPAVEDLVGAGAILTLADPTGLSPEARGAVGAYHTARARLAAILRDCASGRELAAAGFEHDVELASELDATDLVPVLVDGAFAGGMG
jgi:2-phosphosulfolactate phosphatase